MGGVTEMRAPRTVLAGLAAFVVSGAGLATQAGVAVGAPSEPSLSNVSSFVVEQTTAELIGTIDPGEETTRYHFEYGASTAYGTEVPQFGTEISGAEGPVVVGQELTGLRPGTTYHYRLIAKNATGEAVESDQTFTTLPAVPPVARTGQAENVTPNTATLTGTVNTGGFPTFYEFELGADTGYGIRIYGNAGVQPGTQTFTVPLQDLAPGTTYHYRIDATNIFGTVYGVDVTFTTTTYPTATLSGQVVLPLLPTALLVYASESSSGGAGANAASVRPAAQGAARREHAVVVAGRSSGKLPGGHKKRKGGSGGSGRHAHGANGRGK